MNEIFYFSGTGNSLAVARDIAEGINAVFTAIPSVMDLESVETDAACVGIVFPVYNQGVPFIIKRFIDKLRNLDKKYIFGVCTHGGGPGISLKYLGRMIAARGGRLAAGFAVHMPYNYVAPSFVLKNFYKSFKLRGITPEKQQKLFDNWKARVDKICGIIAAQKPAKIESKSDLIENLVDCLNLRETAQKAGWLKIGGFEGKTDLPFIECIQFLDHSFNCDNSCSGCGICAKICPVGNVGIVEGKPVWRHRCEQCFACLHWCPRQAVQFGTKTGGQKRYHHPDVTLKDFMPHSIDLNKSDKEVVENDPNH